MAAGDVAVGGALFDQFRKRRSQTVCSLQDEAVKFRTIYGWVRLL